MLSRKGVNPLPLEQEYAKKTFIKPDDIAKLRAWVTTQPHLPAQYITDLDLILALHCSDRSAEVAKQLIDLHYTLKTIFNIFKNRVLDKGVEKSIKTLLQFPLEQRAHDGSAVIYTRLLDNDAKKFVCHDFVKAMLMLADMWQAEEGTWPGLQLAVDMAEVSLSHLARVDFQTLQEFFYYLQEAMLLNLKRIHFLNAPSFMDRVMMLIKPFMKKQLLDLVVIHQVGEKTIDKYIPMEAFPKETGGEYLSIFEIRDQLIQKFQDSKEFFEQESLKRVTESRRPGRAKTISDYFGGVEGSFKKLDID